MLKTMNEFTTSKLIPINKSNAIERISDNNDEINKAIFEVNIVDKFNIEIF